MIATTPFVDLLAVPWQRGGRRPSGPGAGLDCWGLVIEVRRRLGLVTPDPWPAGDGADAVVLSEVILADFARGWTEVPRDAPEPGDVAGFLAFGGHRTHAGVVLPGALVLHTTQAAGVVCIAYDRIRRHVATLFRGAR